MFIQGHCTGLKCYFHQLLSKKYTNKSNLIITVLILDYYKHYRYSKEKIFP